MQFLCDDPFQFIPVPVPVPVPAFLLSQVPKHNQSEKGVWLN